jgi:uncharacterized protein (DUF1015 family)
MPKIKPFPAVIYNQEKVPDLSKVVCPPYDIINLQAQEYFHNLSPYNLIYLILGKDIPGEDKYGRAKKQMNNWLKEKVLINDDKPAIYFYSQQYTVRGEKKTRLGFLALLKFEDKGGVIPHEHTRQAAKEDRFKLIKQIKANLSPIFVLFPDDKRIIQRTFDNYIAKTAPFIEVTDNDKIVNKVWKLNSADAIQAIQKQMLDKKIFIADGHHRYEVGSMFREEMREKLGKISGEEDFNYILAYFTNVESKGLTILPCNRLVCGISEEDIKKLKDEIKEYFDVEQVKDKTKFFLMMEKAGKRQHAIGIYTGKTFYFVRLKNPKIMDSLIPDKPKEYRMLDVCILNHILLSKILGVDFNDKERIRFIPDPEETIRWADENTDCVGFLLNPVKIEEMMSVALTGERMPPKTTYFYPKVLSGLLINKFNLDNEDASIR